MMRKFLIPILAAGLLGGCVTDYGYRSDGGGYYYGRPSVDYRYHDYDGYYPYGYYPYSYPYYYRYGYPSRYRGYYGYPWSYPYYGYPYYYPYRPRPQPDHDDDDRAPWRNIVPPGHTTPPAGPVPSQQVQPDDRRAPWRRIRVPSGSGPSAVPQAQSQSALRVRPLQPMPQPPVTQPRAGSPAPVVQPRPVPRSQPAAPPSSKRAPWRRIGEGKDERTPE